MNDIDMERYPPPPPPKKNVYKVKIEKEKKMGTIPPPPQN